MSDDAERTEQATERRIEKYREEGKVATSRELLSSLALVAGVLGAAVGVPMIVGAFTSLAQTSMARAATGEIAVNDLPILVQGVLERFGPGVLVILLPPVVVSLIAGLGITSFNVSTEALSPKFERLDPIANFGSRFASATPWVELLKSGGIAALLGWAAWSAIQDELPILPAAASWSAGAQLMFLAHMARAVVERALPFTLLVGLGDYAWQKFQLDKQMKMTKQEVKEENKDSEGDPHIKQRRRQRARQIAQNRQLADVAKADVVVTNPTHYAVALRYRKDENAAPVILARGVDRLALEIRTRASRLDIPVIENRPLARALHARGKVGKAIPKDLYGPVARVLAAVYKRRKPK